MCLLCSKDSLAKDRKNIEESCGWPKYTYSLFGLKSFMRKKNRSNVLPSARQFSLNGLKETQLKFDGLPINCVTIAFFQQLVFHSSVLNLVPKNSGAWILVSFFAKMGEINIH